MKTELELPEVLKNHNRLNIQNYKPNPIAIKLGYCCNVCEGMKIPALYGEKVCSCPILQEDTDWMEERKLLALQLHAEISYECAFICNDCHKLNPLWGQVKDNINVCKFCNHEQPNLPH